MQIDNHDHGSDEKPPTEVVHEAGLMPIDKAASRAWRGQISDILNRQWDPIGGCPLGEYDAYAAKIAAMVRDNATDEALMKYLEWAESVHMGLGWSDPHRARIVIASIRALGKAP